MPVEATGSYIRTGLYGQLTPEAYLTTWMALLESRRNRHLLRRQWQQVVQKGLKELTARGILRWCKQQIAATIPDSLFMKIRDKGTAHQIWLALTKDFQNKSRMVSVDLRRRLQQQRCVEKEDIQAHFATLRTMREDLASMGHPPAEDDFYAIIIGSLPPSYDPFISALNATSSVLGAFLSPDNLMHTIMDEYDC